MKALILTSNSLKDFKELQSRAYSAAELEFLSAENTTWEHSVTPAKLERGMIVIVKLNSKLLAEKGMKTWDYDQPIVAAIATGAAKRVEPVAWPSTATTGKKYTGEVEMVLAYNTQLGPYTMGNFEEISKLRVNMNGLAYYDGVSNG